MRFLATPFEGVRAKAFGALLLCGILYSQTIDTGILGTVTDPTGAVVSNATVSISQPSTGFSRTVQTSNQGAFEIRYLAPGD